MKSWAERELLAPRADVWAFLAEPYHLSDWWPGISGVRPDRRGFSLDARWQVTGSRWTNPFTGRRPMDQLLVIKAIEPYERWSWHLVQEGLDVEVRLRAAGPERTIARVEVEGSWLFGGRESLARQAVERLHALVQTAGT